MEAPDEHEHEGESDEEPETGTNGPAADTPPALPADDDAPLGDTDQHSDA